MANYADTQAFGKSEQIRHFLSRWWDKCVAWHTHRRAYLDAVKELRSLSNRDLADIGLNRSMIKSIALEAADQRVKLK